MTDEVEPLIAATPKDHWLDEWLVLLRRHDVWQGAFLLTIAGSGVMFCAWLYFELFGTIALAR